MRPSAGLAGAAIAWLALSANVMGAQLPPPTEGAVPSAASSPDGTPPSPDKVALADDGLARMTIPVTIDGKGPFPFIIDTGADRTVISQELAASLMLPAGAPVRLHNSGGIDEVPTVVITRLGVGKRIIDRIEAPAVSAANIGAAGILGIDSLKDQHVVMDFRTQQFLSLPSRSEAMEPGTVVVRGRSRFGQLILVDAMVRGVPIYVILDSGAQNTVGNLALRKLLMRGAPHHEDKPFQIVSVTGRRTTAEFEDVAEMHVGGLTIRNVPLAFAELHTFERFGLSDRPAMLLGMDVLGICEKVTVDFKRREATFTLNRE
jgi:predicted aspartyl protease